MMITTCIQGLIPVTIFSDDPYYSGLRARIPNFVKSRKKKQQEKEAKERQQQQQQQQQHAAAAAGPGGLHAAAHSAGLYNPSGAASNPFWWHSRLYNEGAHLNSLNPDGSNYQRTPRMPYITGKLKNRPSIMSSVKLIE